MAVASDVIERNDNTPARMQPHLVALLKWCASLVWSAAELLKRLLEPRLLSLPPPPDAGGDEPRTPHISHAATVECRVLRAPRAHTLDVVFVHGLYGSLANTWRQGQWRKKKTEINKIPLKIHSTAEIICRCNERHSQSVGQDLDLCTCDKKENNTNKNNKLEKVMLENDIDKHKSNIDDRESDEYKDYVISNVEIVEEYTDIMNDLFAKEFNMCERCDINIFSSVDSKNHNNCDANSLNSEDRDQNISESEVNIKERRNYVKNEDTSKKVDVCNCVEDASAREFDPEGTDQGADRKDRTCEVGCGCTCPKCYSDCWPRDWLAVDYPSARVISVNYTSDPHLWRPIWIKEHKRLRLQERARQMAEQLLALGVGRRPVVWVGHSKGGLFIKQIYVQGYEDSASGGAGSALWRQSVGFMFYSVPHRGSPLADYGLPPLLARSIELLEMGKDCADVLALQSRWLRAVARPSPPAVRSLVETRRTLMAVLWLTIVSFESADAGIGALCGVSVDHREICKPSGRACPLYRELIQLMDAALDTHRQNTAL